MYTALVVQQTGAIRSAPPLSVDGVIRRSEGGTSMYRPRLPRAVPALTALILSLLSNAFVPVPAGAHALALSPDGHRLYVAGPTGGIDVIDPQTNAFITRLPIQGVGAGAALALS